MKYGIPTLSQLLQPKFLDRLSWSMSALLVVLLGQGMASLTWSLIPQPRYAAPPPQTGSSSSTPRSAITDGDFARLSELHLFGVAQPKAAAEEAPIDAPETRLNLNLKGILFNTNDARARAIIASPGKPDRALAAGQEISPGVTLERIYADRVILRRQGQYETLRLPESMLGDAGSGQAQPMPQGGQRSASSGGDTAQALAQYRRHLMENPAQASRFIQVEPVNREGGLAGFRIQPGADDRLFNLAGLQPGDIVTSVNGIALDQFDRGFAAVEELSTASEVTLTVVRGGQQQTIRLQLQNR